MRDNMNREHEGQKTVILFTNLPAFDQLLALTVRITSPSNCTHSLNRFQPQVIKCREFIFTEPDVIGSPSADVHDHCFYLIAQADVIKSGRIQARINRVGLEVTPPYDVMPELYQSCLRYTLQARISPNWNKVGQWFLQGRDFLTHTGCCNGIKVDITVNQNELYFTLEATTFKTTPLKVTDLDITTSKLNKFLTDRSAQIDHHDIASDWCFILPSMKKGRIVGITHELPEECPFMTYRDLKRHWKNMYGYRLPDNDDELHYYQICFGSLGGTIFTYPEVCLRGRDLQRLSRIDPRPIMRTFMQEVQSKFPSVCGFPFKLRSKAKFPSIDLQMSSQASFHDPPNLTNKMNSQRPSIYRSKEEMERFLNPQRHVADTKINKPIRPVLANVQDNTCRKATETPAFSGARISDNVQGVQNNVGYSASTIPACSPSLQKVRMISPDQSQCNSQSSRTKLQFQNNNTETSNHFSKDHQNQVTAGKLFPTFPVKKNLFKNHVLGQRTSQKIVPRFSVQKRPFEPVSASSSASANVPVKSSSVGFNDIKMGKLQNIAGGANLNKITPRFFQRKPNGVSDVKTPVSTIVKSRPATKEKSVQPKQKSAKPTKSLKDGTGDAVKRKRLKKAEA